MLPVLAIPLAAPNGLRTGARTGFTLQVEEGWRCVNWWLSASCVFDRAYR
jgi:hypothetical protein